MSRDTEERASPVRGKGMERLRRYPVLWEREKTQLHCGGKPFGGYTGRVIQTKSTSPALRTPTLTSYPRYFSCLYTAFSITFSIYALSSGIEIVAQPPGKKLQLLSLLSGGERALTAIAILFAMLKLKPTPFCMLDEIEAALDDANIDNFADYLKTYSENTQFVVVTHRKGTMARCDALYGVAMEEKGVSKLMSVKLQDAPV